MANVLNLITVGQKLIYEVDANPASGGGTSGTIADIAMFDNGSGVGSAFIKTGAASTAWDQIDTYGSGVSIGQGNILQIPVYDLSPNGYHLNPTVLQNGQTLGIAFVAQPTRSVGITYSVPNPGDAIASADFVLTQGAQTIAGAKTFSNDIVINANLTVTGTRTFVNSTVTDISDPFITLNKGGAAGSGSDVGFYIEENALIAGYLVTSSDRLGFDFKAPATGGTGYPASTGLMTIRTPASNQIYQGPNASGTLVLQVNPSAGVNKQIAYWVSTTNIGNETGSGVAAFTWDATNHFLGLQQVTPKAILHVGNNTTSGTVGGGAIILGVLNATANVGNGAVVIGGQGGANTASGANSVGAGLSCIASGAQAHAIGNGNTASNSNAAAFGSSTIASGLQAFAIGSSTTASQTNSFAGGSSSTASAAQAFAFGTSAIADGTGSSAIGTKAQTGGFAGARVLTDSQNFQTTADTNDQLKMRYTNGYKLVLGGGADNVDGPNEAVTQSTVNTTNATVTTLATIAIPTNSSVKIETTIVGRRTGGTSGAAQDAAVYVRTARLKNVAGVVTIFNLQSDYTSEDQATWNGTIAVSGTNAVVQINGAANNNVTWFATTKVHVNN